MISGKKIWVGYKSPVYTFREQWPLDEGEKEGDFPEVEEDDPINCYNILVKADNQGNFIKSEDQTPILVNTNFLEDLFPWMSK